MFISFFFFFFFFNDTATTEIYTLSLHDALPISRRGPGENPADETPRHRGVQGLPPAGPLRGPRHGPDRRGGPGHRRREGEVTYAREIRFPRLTHGPEGADLAQRHGPEEGRQRVPTDQADQRAHRRRDGGADPAPDEASRRARPQVPRRQRERDVGPLGDADPQEAHRPRRGRTCAAATHADPGARRREHRDCAAFVKPLHSTIEQAIPPNIHGADWLFNGS